MATLQEIIAKRKELGANATNVDARKALTPTAPIAPTDINSDANRLARLQAKGGSPTAIANLQEKTTPAPVTPTPVPPAPMVQAPVDPTTGLSKPLEATPATVAEVKAPEPIKPAKTEPTVDYNVSTGREQEIQDNISKITQASPNLLKDRNAYNQAFGYETADAGKKALLDSTFSGQVKPSQDDIFNSLRAGVTVGDPKSTEFRQAQARLSTFKKFSTYDTASLATSLQSGDLLVGTKAYNDLVSDPTMSAKIQKAQAFNKGVVDLAKIGETQTANIMASNPTVANALADGNLSKEEYDQLTNNEEVSAQLQKVETNKTKYETIKAQYDAVEDDVNTEFEGKEVTDSFKAKVAADRRKGMYKDYQIASLEYQNALGTYTNLKDDATALLGQNMKLYETAQAEKAQIAGEERQMKNQLALSQAQFDQKIAQQAQSMGTPELAIPDVIDQYAQLGVMATVSPQEHIARAKQFIANGGTLGQYISQMQKDFQAKDAYKAKFAPKATENYTLQQLGDKTYKFNQATGDYEVVAPITAGTGGDLRSLAGQFPGQAWAKNNNPAGITWNANFDKGTGTAKLLADAGIQFSKGTARPASEGGNYVTFPTIEDGLKAQQIMMTQTYGNSTVGNMLSSWVGTSEGPNYAKQVAGMAGITDLNQKVSALSPEQVSALQMAKIKKESPGLYGLLSQGTGTQGIQGDNLTTILKTAKLGEGTKTNIAKMQGVIEAIDTFAKNNPEGDIPGVSKGVSFDIFSSPESIANRGYLDTINLIVQQWASGASLTESQIKQVNKLVPGEYDTDKTARAKLNNLKNFMNDQVKATLNVSGVEYNPKKTDLWADKSTNTQQLTVGGEDPNL